jgi:hypothetical protein
VLSRGAYQEGAIRLERHCPLIPASTFPDLPRPSPTFPVLPVFPSRLSHHQSFNRMRLHDRFQLVHHSARQVPVDVLR